MATPYKVKRSVSRHLRRLKRRLREGGICPHKDNRGGQHPAMFLHDFHEGSKLMINSNREADAKP